MCYIDKTFPELNYNEIGGKAAYADVIVDALYEKNSSLSNFEKKILEETIELCMVLKTGYDANKRDQMTISELGPYKLIKPLIEAKSTEIKDILIHTDNVLEILLKRQNESTNKRITKSEYEMLTNFFGGISEIYLKLARKNTNLRLRY